MRSISRRPAGFRSRVPRASFGHWGKFRRADPFPSGIDMPATRTTARLSSSNRNGTLSVAGGTRVKAASHGDILNQHPLTAGESLQWLEIQPFLPFVGQLIVLHGTAIASLRR